MEIRFVLRDQHTQTSWFAWFLRTNGLSKFGYSIRLSNEAPSQESLGNREAESKLDEVFGVSEQIEDNERLQSLVDSDFKLVNIKHLIRVATIFESDMMYQIP